jgi:glucose 1-dehydrogenase
VNDLHADTAEATASAIRAAGGRAVAVCADVANLAEHDKLIGAAVREFGALDILVNNAGIEFIESVIDAKPDTWDRTLGTNLKGPYFLSSKAAAHMVQPGGGNIIFISSVHDSQPHLRDHAIYSISKGGVTMLVRSLAVELAEHKIRVNAISPGAILTGMTRGLSGPAVLSNLLARIPLKRLGDPEDIVGAATFLASAESNYVTGATIYVDGGFLLI